MLSPDQNQPAKTAKAEDKDVSWRLIGLLMAVTGTASLSLNILVPAVPGMAKTLNTSPANVQLTISLYLLSLAFAQLAMGTLSDRFGRRPVMLGGLTVFVLATLACALVSTIEGLVIARIVQALGAASGVAVGRAIIRDLASRERTASLIGMITTVTVISPMIAPLVGGVIDTFFGWQSVFIVTATLGMIMLVWSALVLPETQSAVAMTGGIANFRADIRVLSASPSFFGYALTGAIICGPFFLFVGGAPHIVVTTLGHTSAEYGLWWTLPSLGYMIGSFMTSRLATRYGLHVLIRWGLAVAFIGAVLNCATSFWIAELGLVAFFAPQILVSLGNGLVLPNTIAGAVSVRPQAAGAAAGFCGFTQMIFGAAAAQLASYIVAGATGPVPLTIAAVISTALAIVPYVLLVRRRTVEEQIHQKKP